MTIDYIKRDESLEIECDQCGEIETFKGSFPECIETAKNNEWIIFKDGFAFVHFCDQECSEEFQNI